VDRPQPPRHIPMAAPQMRVIGTSLVGKRIPLLRNQGPERRSREGADDIGRIRHSAGTHSVSTRTLPPPCVADSTSSNLLAPGKPRLSRHRVPETLQGTNREPPLAPRSPPRPACIPRLARDPDRLSAPISLRCGCCQIRPIGLTILHSSRMLATVGIHIGLRPGQPSDFAHF
jgi:hypothetical protein